MKIPSSIDIAKIDWTSTAAQRLTLRDIHNWHTAATQPSFVQPKSEEEAWEGTEIDVCRTVL